MADILSLMEPVHPTIPEYVDTARRATEKLRDVLEQVQTTCKHKTVLESELSWTPSRRICTACRLELIKDLPSGYGPLGNSEERVIFHVDWNQYVSYRIDGAVAILTATEYVKAHPPLPTSIPEY